MDILKAMQVYVAVVETGSLVAAAVRLDTSSTAVSRHVAGLEQHLGARLLNRTTRRVSMTDAGQEFYSRAQQILSDVSEAEALAGESAVRPGGLLRISAPLSFGISTLSRWLPDFLQRYPELRLDVDLTDRVVDLATDGIDVAVRIARQPGSTNVITRRLAPVRMRVCAAPAYLARKGRPSKPADLVDHETLSYSYLSTGDSWALTDRDGHEATVRIRPHVQATNGDMLRELACAGLGVIVQPTFIVEDDITAGRLVPLLEDWSMEGFSLYAVYLSRKFLSAKVRVFIDHLSAMAGRSP
jgi:DNA-binding transcriptional LysR family regulator